MRTIKFKAKCQQSGEWVEGDLIHGVANKSGNMYILRKVKNLAYVKHCDPLDGVQVDPETVCQFWVSRKDFDLWEGDKVLVNGRRRVGQYETHIIFDGNQFRVADNKTYMNDYATYLTVQQVTGNIHDK